MNKNNNLRINYFTIACWRAQAALARALIRSGLSVMNMRNKITSRGRGKSRN
jgi:hypothetical protein